MAKFDQIANALSGFGAGIQGRGPEFIKGLADDKQRLSDDRKRAAAIDMYKAYNLLDSGNIDGAMNFGEERHNAIVKLGGDPSDTVQFMRQLSEDPSGQTAKRDLEIALKMASAQKFINLPDLFSKQKPTSMMQNVAQIAPEGSPEYKRIIQELLSRPTGTTVNVGGEQTEAQQLAKSRVSGYEGIQEDASNARTTLESLNQLRAINVEQGISSDFRFNLVNSLASLGVDASELFKVDLTNAQSFNAITSSLVNDVINAAKGPQTEGDAIRAKSTIARLGNTPEANEFINNTMRSVALRKIEQSDFMEQILDSGGNLRKAKRDWNAYKSKTPMLSNVGNLSKNGLPVYFFQFKENAQKARPGITTPEIVEEWRKVNAPRR